MRRNDEYILSNIDFEKINKAIGNVSEEVKEAIYDVAYKGAYNLMVAAISRNTDVVINDDINDFKQVYHLLKRNHAIKEIIIVPENPALPKAKITGINAKFYIIEALRQQFNDSDINEKALNPKNPFTQTAKFIKKELYPFLPNRKKSEIAVEILEAIKFPFSEVTDQLPEIYIKDL